VPLAEILESEFRRRNLKVSQSAQDLLTRYAGEIEHWNCKVNLTALSGESLVRRLIVEPIWVGERLQMDGVLADVGSGNGSPGIPLVVTRPFSAAHLIEPRLKRAVFLRHVVAKLGLSDVVVDRTRVEELQARSLISDWIVLQAIDPTPDLIRALRNIGSETTRVVWITSLGSCRVQSAERIDVPDSSTKVWIFRLDQI